MARIEKIVAGLPEAERVDVAEWGDHPTFRVDVHPAGYGLGRLVEEEGKP